MDLSKGEKLLLIMLCDLYQQLSIRSDIDPQIVKNAIVNDQTWGIEWEYSGLLGSEGGPFPPIVKEVGDILDMWSFIKESYAQISSAEKCNLQILSGDLCEISADKMVFPGFDFDAEQEHYIVAKFFISQLGMFPALHSDSLNACTPVLKGHKRMMDVFTPMRAKVSGRLLNAAELLEIFKSQELLAEQEDLKVG
ncbi:MAG TPA: hypothetical protein DD400_00315 [Rhodospirillaceae bacterium]|nr:hypothetical protein [Rhodospirillaceae bacterium]